MGEKTAWQQLCEILCESGVRVTFSINCHSGLESMLGPGHQCGCWRCREERSEEWTEETEAQAAVDSEEAQRLFRACSLRFLPPAEKGGPA